MRRATEEQKAKAAERRANMRKLAATISKMSDQERADLMAKLPGVVTIEGRALSFHNQCMIAMQMPSASVVGGFRQWKKAGRSVMKGQHGAAIWFPLGDKKQDGTADTGDAGDEKTSCRFGLATVFDIKQTEDSATAEARRNGETEKTDWAEEKAAGWKGKDIHGCYTMDASAVVTEAELKASCEKQLYGAPLALPAPAIPHISDAGPDWSDMAYEDSCRDACGL